MSRQIEFDLAVVGGGPAGAAAAITAARSGARVVLLESGTFPRHKVCGEFVSAESLQILRELLQSVPQIKATLEGVPSITRMRVLWRDQMLEAPVSPTGISLPRFTLDKLLWEAAKISGVDALASCEVLALEGDGPFVLQTRDGELRAQAVILASGRWSRFTGDRNLPPGPKWMGVKAHFHERSSPPSTDLYFFEGGYCGVQPVSDSFVNACAMVRSDCATNLEQVFARHPALARRSAGWSAATSPVTTSPLIYRQPEPVRGNLMLVGDAAAFIDPFTGDGISISLRTGTAAAKSLTEFLTGSVPLTYAVAAYRERYHHQFSPLLNSAARVRTLLRLPVFVQAIAFQALRLPGVMPYIIRKTRRA